MGYFLSTAQEYITQEIIAVDTVLTGSPYYNTVRDKTDQNVYGHRHVIRFLIMLVDGATFSIDIYNLCV